MANISEVIYWFKDNIIPLVVILVIFSLGYKFSAFISARMISLALRAFGEAGHAKAKVLFSKAFLRVIRAVFVILIVLYLLPLLGVDIVPLLAGLGIGGLALGFAAQFLLRDVISGLVLLGENRFKEGDKVSIAGLVGTVEDFDLRGLYVKGDGGENHYIPFGEIRTITKISNS